MKSINWTLLWHVEIEFVGLVFYTKRLIAIIFLRTMGVLQRSPSQTAYKMCPIFGSYRKLVVLPIEPQACIFTPLAIDRLPSPTAKPLPFRLACLLGKRSSLLSQLASTGNHELLEHPLSLIFKHGRKKKVHLMSVLPRD